MISHASGRYKPWIVNQPVESGVLATVLDKFLKRCLDNNKRVQEAAISVRFCYHNLCNTAWIQHSSANMQYVMS